MLFSVLQMFLWCLKMSDVVVFFVLIVSLGYLRNMSRRFILSSGVSVVCQCSTLIHLLPSSEVGVAAKVDRNSCVH